MALRACLEPKLAAQASSHGHGTAKMVQRMRKVGKTTSRLGPRLGRKVASSYMVQSLKNVAAEGVQAPLSSSQLCFSSCFIDVQGLRWLAKLPKQRIEALLGIELGVDHQHPVRELKEDVQVLDALLLEILVGLVDAAAV